MVTDTFIKLRKIANWGDLSQGSFGTGSWGYNQGMDTSFESPPPRPQDEPGNIDLSENGVYVQGVRSFPGHITDSAASFSIDALRHSYNAAHLLGQYASNTINALGNAGIEFAQQKLGLPTPTASSWSDSLDRGHVWWSNLLARTGQSVNVAADDLLPDYPNMPDYQRTAALATGYAPSTAAAIKAFGSPLPWLALGLVTPAFGTSLINGYASITNKDPSEAVDPRVIQAADYVGNLPFYAEVRNSLGQHYGSAGASMAASTAANPRSVFNFGNSGNIRLAEYIPETYMAQANGFLLGNHELVDTVWGHGPDAESSAARTINTLAPMLLRYANGSIDSAEFDAWVRTLPHGELKSSMLSLQSLTPDERRIAVSRMLNSLSYRFNPHTLARGTLRRIDI